MSTARNLAPAIVPGAGGIAACHASASEHKHSPAEPTARGQAVAILAANSNIAILKTAQK
jgi:hypothetical protein